MCLVISVDWWSTIDMDAKEFKEAFDPSVQFIATDQITGIYTFLHAVSLIDKLMLTRVISRSSYFCS